MGKVSESNCLPNAEDGKFVGDADVVLEFCLVVMLLLLGTCLLQFKTHRKISSWKLFCSMWPIAKNFMLKWTTITWKAIGEFIPNEVAAIEKKRGKKDKDKTPSIVGIQGPKPGKPTDLARKHHSLKYVTSGSYVICGTKDQLWTYCL